MNNLLIKDSETLRKWLPEITVQKDFETCRPLLENVNENFIIPLLGDNLVKHLVESLDNGNDSGSPSGSASADVGLLKSKVIVFAQSALAYGFAFEHSKTGDVKFTSMGLQSLETDNQKGISGYQKRDIMVANAQRMDQAIDKMLLNLEKWNPDLWPDNLKTEYKSSFIRNADQYSEVCNIYNSRRTFIALKQFIFDNELILIAPILGDDLYAELKKTLQGKGKAEKSATRVKIEKLIIEKYIPSALAHASMADGLEMLSLRLFSDSVTFSSYLGLLGKERNSDYSEKDARKAAHQKRSQTFLNEIRKTLDKHIDLFPEYKPAEGSIDYENDEDANHFVM